MRLPARLVFPGGGIFFWWQAGAITSLSKRVDLATVPCCGASAGSTPRNSRRPAPQTLRTHAKLQDPKRSGPVASSACMCSGALAATLAACDVDMDLALERALSLCDESGALDRGAWGLCLCRHILDPGPGLDPGPSL